MNLEQAIKQHNGEFLYIGSACGYITMGEEISLEELSEADAYYKAKFEKTREKYLSDIKTMPARVKAYEQKAQELKEVLAYIKAKQKKKLNAFIKYSGRKTNIHNQVIEALDNFDNKEELKRISSDMEEEMAKCIRLCDELPIRIEGFKKRLPALEKTIENYEPFITRKVLAMYNHLTEPKGTVIIVKGKENGDYWDYEEYLKGRKQE